ncbi:MAG: lysophospholipid acyltransferase family protein [Aquisalimonadaceae bacterium]
MPLLRRLIRIPLLLLHVAVGVVVIGLAIGLDRLKGMDPGRGMARGAQAFWCRSICAILGVRLRATGQRLLSPPVLLVANHISWLDILVVAAYWDVCFLSKSEVRRWPGIGWLATGFGTVYIERGQRGASTEAIETMKRRLRQCRRVLFFPEGTTSHGQDLLPFRPRLFQAAIEDGIPVQPVTIRFIGRDGQPSARAAFVGGDRLFRHVIELAGNPGIDAIVTVGEPEDSAERSRKELALLMREQMAELLNPSRPADRQQA